MTTTETTSAMEANKRALLQLQELLEWKKPNAHGVYLETEREEHAWRLGFSTEENARKASAALQKAGCHVRYAAPLAHFKGEMGRELEEQLLRSIQLERPDEDQSKRVDDATAKLRPAILQELERAVLNRSDQYRRLGASAEECRMLAENVRGTLMDPPLDLSHPTSLAAKHDPASRTVAKTAR